MKRNRRQFLRGSSLAFGAVTAGSLKAIDSAAATTRDVGRRSASFGWELNLDNNGAVLFFGIPEAMTLEILDVDLAYTITSLPPAEGFTEVLCRGAVSRGAAPSVQPDGYLFPESPDFGGVQVLNPENLYGYDRILLQDVFYAVILKSWVPRDGTASATYRNTHTEPSLTLAAGDFLVFTMDGDGPPADVEMQVVLGYSLGSPLPRVISR